MTTSVATSILISYHNCFGCQIFRGKWFLRIGRGCGFSRCRYFPRYHHPATRLDSSERKMHAHPRSHGLTHNLILEGVQLEMLLLLKTVSNTRLQAFLWCRALSFKTKVRWWTINQRRRALPHPWGAPPKPRATFILTIITLTVGDLFS